MNGLLLYGAAWVLTLLYMQISRRGSAGIRGEVRLSMAPRALIILLAFFDLLIVVAACALVAAPFFLLSPWWTSLGVFAGAFVLASIVTGTATAHMLRTIDLPELYVRWGAVLALVALAACTAVWWYVAAQIGWL